MMVRDRIFGKKYTSLKSRKSGIRFKVHLDVVGYVSFLEGRYEKSTSSGSWAKYENLSRPHF